MMKVCKENLHFTEAGLAMQQLQIILESIERSITQWGEYVQKLGVTNCMLDFEQTLMDAADLRRSIQQIESKLVDANHQHSPAITITTFK
ncbi:hypothetical protein [Ammoniphilus resinae]|uniref:Nucleic acid-binding Zn-ribbon protein n=1 Tax=Ammoniphilus resinae TaxID=861532 RepID=A0ABS4GM07_9BACL|nr:hypothetical protein [Ammoniphilus resinae]MBP1931102.1 putative nucleic acid-binding Zn-ribbon protein [Ammoniphilus resinae]